MNFSNSSKLPPSLNIVDARAGLTINVSQAHLQVGPNLLPPPVAPTKNESSFLCEQESSYNLLNVPYIPSISEPLCQPATTRSSEPRRSRYILPPQLGASPAPIFSSFAGSIVPPSMAVPLQSPIISEPAPFTAPTVLSTPAMPPFPEAPFHPMTSVDSFIPTGISSSPTDAAFVQPAVSPATTKSTVLESVQPTQFFNEFSSTRILPTPDFLKESEPLQTQQPVATYTPVQAHWFYATKMSGMTIWWPFDRYDSDRLEAEAAASDLLYPPGLTRATATSPSESSGVTVSVRGGRFDVILHERKCKAVYWDEEKNEVRRTTWLFRPQNEQRVLPFSEKMCMALEEHYREALESNTWGVKFTLPSEKNEAAVDLFIFHSAEFMVQHRAYPYRSVSVSDSPSAEDRLTSESADELSHLCIIHRGLNSELASLVSPGDSRPIEHVAFVVHGIGSIYNLRGEGLIECVNDMRTTCDTLMRSHFPSASGRIEFLPVRWHSTLHSEATGINNQLRRVTLRSIPKLRRYTNNTLTDILFYTSPKYCQHIVDTVASCILNQRRLFLQRNSSFSGTFSIVGHSLGAVIVYDLLSHQRRVSESIQSNEADLDGRRGEGEADDDDWSLVEDSTTSTTPENPSEEENLRKKLSQVNLSEAQIQLVIKSLLADRKSPTLGNMAAAGGVGMPVVQYPQLGFSFSACFLLGSPLSVFLTARGIDRLPYDFRFATCPTVCNIFHPFDPVAYRLETMIVPDYKPCAMLVPHHTGRKRFHLEFKDNLARVGADIKAKVYDSLRSTWRTLQEFASAHTSSDRQEPSQVDETDEVSDAIKTVLTKLSDEVDNQGTKSKAGDREDDDEEDTTSSFPSQLNQGRRIDHVLQYAPLESLSDYLFALTSHAAYWESADCVLFMLNEIFAAPPPPLSSDRQQTLQRKKNLTAAMKSALKDQSAVGGSSHSSLYEDPPLATGGYQEMPLTATAKFPGSLSSSASTSVLDRHIIAPSAHMTALPIPQTSLYAHNQPQSSSELFGTSNLPKAQLANPPNPQSSISQPPSRASLSDVFAVSDGLHMSAAPAGLVEIDLAESPK